MEGEIMKLPICKYIDHTLLKPDATIEQIIQLCTEAKEHDFAAVCVNPTYVALAAHLLAGTDVKTATVIGFPLGATFSEVKALEALTAVKAKADEIDMVINIGAVKAAQWDAVANDIKAVVTAAEDALVKVILETALLTDDEKRQACQIAMKAGAHFVKTSTGFGPAGATVADVALLKEVIGDTGRCGIKASGGIKNYQQTVALLEAGATRIGTSSGIAIIKDAG